MKFIALAHHALTPDWYNISLITIAYAEWLDRPALCVIDSSQPADKREQLVHVVCKRKFPSDYRISEYHFNLFGKYLLLQD